MLQFVIFNRGTVKPPIAINPDHVATVEKSGQVDGVYYVLLACPGVDGDTSFHLLSVDHDGDLQSLCDKLRGKSPKTEDKPRVAVKLSPRPVPKSWEAFRLDLAESLNQGLKCYVADNPTETQEVYHARCELRGAINTIAAITKYAMPSRGITDTVRAGWSNVCNKEFGPQWEETITSVVHDTICDVLRLCGFKGPEERAIAEAAVSWWLMRPWTRPF